MIESCLEFSQRFAYCFYTLYIKYIFNNSLFVLRSCSVIPYCNDLWYMKKCVENMVSFASIQCKDYKDGALLFLNPLTPKWKSLLLLLKPLFSFNTLFSQCIYFDIIMVTPKPFLSFTVLCKRQLQLKCFVHLHNNYFKYCTLTVFLQFCL